MGRISPGSSNGRIHLQYRYGSRQATPWFDQLTSSSETDSGVRVFLNGQPIIVDRMPAATEADAVGERAVTLPAVAGKAGRHFTESKPIELTGGEKYKIRVELVHTSHLKYENADSCYLK